MTRRRLRAARAELMLAGGNPSEALTMVEGLYETAVNQTRPADIPRLALLQGRALVALGRHDEAQAILDEALLDAREREFLPLLWRIHAARGSLLNHADQADQAARELKAARTIVSDVAAELADAGLRERFLTRASWMIDREGAPGIR